MARRSPQWRTRRAASTCSCTIAGASCSGATRSRDGSIANSRGWSARSRRRHEGARPSRRDVSSPCSARRASSSSRSSKPKGGSTATASSCGTPSTPAAREAARCTGVCSIRSSSEHSTRRSAGAPPRRVPSDASRSSTAVSSLERRSSGAPAICAFRTRHSANSSAACSRDIVSPRKRARRRGPKRQSTRKCSAARSNRSWPPAIAVRRARSTLRGRSSNAWAAKGSSPRWKRSMFRPRSCTRRATVSRCRRRLATRFAEHCRRSAFSTRRADRGRSWCICSSASPISRAPPATSAP